MPPIRSGGYSSFNLNHFLARCEAALELDGQGGKRLTLFLLDLYLFRNCADPVYIVWGAYSIALHMSCTDSELEIE